MPLVVEVVRPKNRTSAHRVEIQWTEPSSGLARALRASSWTTRKSAESAAAALRSALATGRVGVARDSENLWLTYHGANLAFFEPFRTWNVSLNVADDLTLALQTTANGRCDPDIPTWLAVRHDYGNWRLDFASSVETYSPHVIGANREEALAAVERVYKTTRPGQTWASNINVVRSWRPGRFFVCVADCPEISEVNVGYPLRLALSYARLLRSFLVNPCKAPGVSDPVTRYDREVL